MRHGNLTREQAIELTGVRTMAALDSINCEPTGRCDATLDMDGVEEYAASVKTTDHDNGDTMTLSAYYYPTKAELDAAGDDLGQVDWEIVGYEVL